MKDCILQRSLELLEAMTPRSAAQRKAIFARMDSRRYALPIRPSGEIQLPRLEISSTGKKGFPVKTSSKLRKGLTDPKVRKKIADAIRKLRSYREGVASSYLVNLGVIVRRTRAQRISDNRG